MPRGIPKAGHRADRANPDAMEIKLTKRQALELIRIGLDSGEGPVVIKDGFEAQRIRMTANCVRFDLVPLMPCPAGAWPETRVRTMNPPEEEEDEA